MKKTYKNPVGIVILIFFLLTILQPLWKLQSLEVGNNTNFIKNKDDEVFMQIKNMSAGDCIQDTFIVRNNFHFPFDVKLQCEKVVENNENSFLFDKLNISIMCEGKELYKGLLSKVSKKNDYCVDLGVYNAAQERNLNVKVYLDNNINLDDNEKNNIFKLKFTTNNKKNIMFLLNREKIKYNCLMIRLINHKICNLFPMKIKLPLCRFKKIKKSKDKLNLYEYLI
ncbi:hypothetical protein [Clostridium tarantellae]|uniref:Uncharacterized protein n=1 Tax=Clostridium tarantellae TaxID=39493 RepID=A0A6I1MR86_9CLOT|nr:hypothetical protein [Clostridium tarantellae]MPQ44687.1 hypothetical protein [Clostridium tarantellae]